ncbi:hypothetical protein E1264_37315 [Actinomadura sp. KC216]|uniref:hypothetical protein n=1 Tax=Actinomadura sp. KC216 TaxID=2530370 RepID=UPI00105056AD|nr:hypothetical protein [Actinomadura sp. KC216]TDB77757.1 hypothetical protein E1264_37315 [Actinomadura sp. KC216]
MYSYAPVPPPPAEPAGDQPQRASARRWVVPLCVLGAVAVLVPVLWATGGLAETPKQPSQPAGKALDLGLFTVTVRDARVGLVDGGFGGKKERFLIVRMRVVNKGKETKSLNTGGLADGVAALTKDGKWVKPEQVEGVAGGAETIVAQPELPVEVSAMWKLGPADAPRKLTVGLRKWTYDHGFTDSTFTWRVDRESDTLVGRLTLPVAESSASSPEPQPSFGTGPQPQASRTPAGRPARRSPWPTVSPR